MIKKFLITILFTLVLSGGASAEIIYKCIDLKKPEKYPKFEVRIDEDSKKLFMSMEMVKKGKIINNETYMIIKNWNNKEILYYWPGYDTDFKIDYSTDKFYEYAILKNKVKPYSECNRVNDTGVDDTKQSIEFNIAEKKEQCEAIGFKPETDKFADCVLRLVELDVKQQTQNQIVSAQNSGNDALVKQLERQNNLQSSQALINLGQQLMNPKQNNSNIYMPQTRRCTVSGVGVTSVVRCY
jgi:hypothetical protein